MADWENQTDVIVVGSGFAGLAAAIEAANAGAFPVTIVEKMPTPGGHSIYNAGQIALVGSKQQEKAHIEDSVHVMVKDMLAAELDMNRSDLLLKMIESSKETVEWTESELAVKYKRGVTLPGGHSVPRTISTMKASGRDIIDPMLNRVRHHPSIHIILSTRVDRIIICPKTGRVHGLEVTDEMLNESFAMTCKNGLVLATTELSVDIKFHENQNPAAFREGAMPLQYPSATAEANAKVLREALTLGARSAHARHTELKLWALPDEQGYGQAPYFCIGAGFPYGIIVNPTTSRRLVNELGNRFERSMAILKSGHPAICVVDAHGATHSLQQDTEQQKPTVKAYESLHDVARAYHIDESIFLQTIDTYNTGLLAGKDEFGKPFPNDHKPIETPPFYATQLWPTVHHCNGGLHINDEAQVMYIDGVPIKGLFAAGEITGGVHGSHRFGSCATLDCLTFGRIAGRNAARCS